MADEDLVVPDSGQLLVQIGKGNKQLNGDDTVIGFVESGWWKREVKLLTAEGGKWGNYGSGEFRAAGWSGGGGWGKGGGGFGGYNGSDGEAGLEVNYYVSVHERNRERTGRGGRGSGAMLPRIPGLSVTPGRPGEPDGGRGGGGGGVLINGEPEREDVFRAWDGLGINWDGEGYGAGGGGGGSRQGVVGVAIIY